MINVCNPEINVFTSSNTDISSFTVFGYTLDLCICICVREGLKNPSRGNFGHGGGVPSFTVRENLLKIGPIGKKLISICDEVGGTGVGGTPFFR